jgi:hypothetical protein
LNGEAFHVELDNGKIIKMVPVMDIRRVTQIETAHKHFSRGDRVSAQFPGEPGEWYPGFIAKVNKDDTFAIQYDDGDFSPKVPSRVVLPLSEDEE